MTDSCKVSHDSIGSTDVVLGVDASTPPVVIMLGM